MALLRKLSLVTVLLTLSLRLHVSAQGTQFITGDCTNDAICASRCCGFNSGKCAGHINAQERDGGCGFGDDEPNDGTAQITPYITAPVNITTPALNSTELVGNNTLIGNGTELIGHNTLINNGTELVGKNKLTINGTELVGNNTLITNGTELITNGTELITNGTELITNGTVPTSNETATPEVAIGTQFITGACTSDAICASGCCGFNSGKCAGPVVAQERDGGCGFGNAVPNDDAARALIGKKRYVVRIRGRAILSALFG